MTAMTRWLTGALLALTALLTACATPARHAALQDPALPQLIPARAFFANTASSGGHQVSHDGRRLAWMF
jgi:hypothetical protein